MKVLLTGGTGFVGSHAAEALLEEGHEVVAMVRETSDVEHLRMLGVEMVTGSLGQAVEVRSVLQEVEAVVHIAGITAGVDPTLLYRVNAAGTRDLVDRVAEVCGSGTRFVYISSISAQGPSTGPGPRSKDLLPNPVSHYGQSKLDGEGAVLAHRDELAVTILRPPVVYGPRDRDMLEVFALANRRITPVLSGESRSLSVVHGEDLGRAIAACLSAPGQGEVYPVDDGNCYTWQQLGELTAEAVGKKTLTLPVPPVMMAGAAWLAEVGGGLLNTTATFTRDKYREMVQTSWVCGHDEIRGDLGWEPRWTYGEGARQTVEWYRERGWL